MQNVSARINFLGGVYILLTILKARAKKRSRHARLATIFYNNCDTISICLTINSYFDWKPILEEVTHCDNPVRAATLGLGYRMRYKSSMCKYTTVVKLTSM